MKKKDQQNMGSICRNWGQPIASWINNSKVFYVLKIKKKYLLVVAFLRNCIKCRDFTEFPGVEILWKRIVSVGRFAQSST